MYDASIFTDSSTDADKRAAGGFFGGGGFGFFEGAGGLGLLGGKGAEGVVCLGGLGVGTSMLGDEGSFLGEGLLDAGEPGALLAVLLLLSKSEGGPDLGVDGSPIGRGGTFLDLLETGKGGGTVVFSIEVPHTDILSTRVGNDLPLNVASTPKAEQ